MNMQSSRTAFSAPDHRGERGGTRLKFLIVVALLAAVAYSGYNYIPVAYQAYLFKDYMQTTVDKATALGQPADWVVTQLKASGAQYDVPPNADVKAQMNNGRMEATVRFSKPIALPFYTYLYTFNNTVRSTDLFTQKPNP
jgi:hypothetical protein